MQKLRLKTLERSATISPEEKVALKVGLTAKFMSPEHSDEEIEERGSSADSDEDAPAVPKKIIKVRPLSWRSDRFYKTLMSLDRKWLRRTSDKARSMIKDRILGEPIEVEAPEEIPDWMVKER